MTFFEKYSLTKGNLSEPKFRRVAMTAPWNKMEAGLYNDGIITIFDKSYDDKFINSWHWLVGNNIIILGCTCWGDFFYVDMNYGEFYIVLANEYKKFPMGNSFTSVFDMNLPVEKFQKAILRLDEFALFRKEVGPIAYGEVYIKNNRTGVRGKKNLSLILDIAGQTGQQLKTIA